MDLNQIVSFLDKVKPNNNHEHKLYNTRFINSSTELLKIYKILCQPCDIFQLHFGFYALLFLVVLNLQFKKRILRLDKLSLFIV